MNDIWYGIEAIFKVLFGLLTILGNIPNIFFILVITALVVFWVRYGVKAENEENDNYLSR